MAVSARPIFYPDMLQIMSESQTKAGNQECLNVYAEQLLFSCLGSKVAVYSRKLQWIFFCFWDITITRFCEFRSHRAGSQLKTNKENNVFKDGIGV